MLGICLIGAGRIGRLHAANVAASGRARLVRVVDPDLDAAGRLAAPSGAQAGANVEAALADPAVGAVMVCSPTDTHVEVIEAAALAGKAVFCEKPVDLAMARVERAREALARRPVPFMIGFHRRFDPAHQALQAARAGGRVGRVVQMHLVARDPGPPPAEYVRRSGGIFRDMMIHDLDQMRFLSGEEFVGVHALAGRLVAPMYEDEGLDDFDTATCTFWTAAGLACVVQNCRQAAYGFDQRAELLGDNGGVLRVENRPRSPFAAFDAEGYRGDRLVHHFPERYAEAYRLELDAFIEAVASGAAASPGMEDARAALLLADAADRSARERRPVTVSA